MISLDLSRTSFPRIDQGNSFFNFGVGVLVGAWVRVWRRRLGPQTLGIQGKNFTVVSRDSTFQIGKSVRFYEKLKIDDAFETMPKRFLMNLNEDELLLS